MENLAFWGPALALAGISVALIVLGLVRGARLRTEAPTTQDRRELRIYADQLREIERDTARGLIDPAEAQRLRTEVARRLLDADRAERAPLREAPRAARIVALATVPAVIAVALVVYLQAGAPMYPDMPLAARHAEAAQMRASRPDQATLEADWALVRPAQTDPDPQYVALMEQLRAALATRPDDLRGHRLLAQNEANLRNFAAAAAAQARVVALQGADVALVDQVLLAEYLVAAAGGVVSPQAERVLESILRRDPRNLQARYYTGLMFAQTGRPDLTFQLWRGVLDDSTPDAPWVPSIRATIEDLAAISGVRYTLPPLAVQGGRGPSADDIAAAEALDGDDRAAMIGAMVEGLATRLGNQGGPPEDWARLIQALGVLGQVDRARAIWSEARLVFAESPAALELIQAAGDPMGFRP